MSDGWVAKQAAKYSDPKKGFGEADKVVELGLKAYLKALELAKPGMRFLDLGANSCRVALEMKDRGLTVLAVDLPEVLAKVLHDVPKSAMDLEKSFPEGEWDLVYCRETIEHLRNYAEFCGKALKCLAPGGTLILTAPCDDMDGQHNCPEHVRVFKGKELDELVIANGGEVIEAFKERRQRVVVAKKR